nr:uncharacterized protein CI109_003358 [Kwoniella shandongensis]KAA5528457.1 hypothetical protein CI109_003358 [Kwoniella shandongensis]
MSDSEEMSDDPSYYGFAPKPSSSRQSESSRGLTECKPEEPVITVVEMEVLFDYLQPEDQHGDNDGKTFAGVSIASSAYTRRGHVPNTAERKVVRDQTTSLRARLNDWAKQGTEDGTFKSIYEDHGEAELRSRFFEHVRDCVDDVSSQPGTRCPLHTILKDEDRSNISTRYEEVDFK